MFLEHEKHNEAYKNYEQSLFIMPKLSKSLLLKLLSFILSMIFGRLINIE